MSADKQEKSDIWSFLPPTKCIACGRFVSYGSMVDGSARFYFEPDSHRGPEISEWTCAACVSAEVRRALADDWCGEFKPKRKT